MIKANEKYTILYARLSQDDNTQGDSNSILNQKLILEKYAKDNNFEKTLFLFDDGFTGTNFERPSFKEAIKLIENGDVSTFIVKDLSRFGRNYISIGQYTEILFPNHNVRFIAIYDGVDSRFEYTTDFAPMKNFFNELYAKDCSKKIKASHRAIAENGGRVGVRPPFGYIKDPENKKRGIVPDEDTAPIVKYIFQLCVSGRGPSQIAKQLNEEKIPSCSYFYFLKYGVKLKGYDEENPYIWSTKNISHILD
ncbi:MAG: recombinase family protein, partial [Lachnospirales bacterium]